MLLDVLKKTEIFSPEKKKHYYPDYYIKIFLKSKPALHWKIQWEYMRNEHPFSPHNGYRYKVYGNMYICPVSKGPGLCSFLLTSEGFAKWAIKQA